MWCWDHQLPNSSSPGLFVNTLFYLYMSVAKFYWTSLESMEAWKLQNIFAVPFFQQLFAQSVQSSFLALSKLAGFHVKPLGEGALS